MTSRRTRLFYVAVAGLVLATATTPGLARCLAQRQAQGDCGIAGALRALRRASGSEGRVPAMKAALLASALIASAIPDTTPQGQNAMNTKDAVPAPEAQPHPYVGLWVTADGHIRHQLLPNGRYVEARGSREGAYRGRYEVRGDDIFYWDDTGFTADGKFTDNVLYHAGMILRRASR